MARMKPIDRGTWLALIAMGIAVFVIANDFSAINVAIPQIEHDFKTDVTTAQWVVNAYALVFGVLIVTGGRLADIFGRRRAFFIGTTIFATFSALGGAAQSEAWLIAMRVLMGIGGALMWPAILGMTYAALPDERAGLAVGFILGAAGIGNAAGPLIGGALTDLLSWRWIFFLNVVTFGHPATQIDRRSWRNIASACAPAGCARNSRTTAAIATGSSSGCGRGTPYSGGIKTEAANAANVRSAAVNRSPQRYGRSSLSRFATVSKTIRTWASDCAAVVGVMSRKRSITRATAG